MVVEAAVKQLDSLTAEAAVIIVIRCLCDRRLVAEAAVKQLDLPTAEAAFVRCSDYAGIQFVKKLHNIHNDTLKKGEVAAYFKDFSEAEKLYLEVDRR